MNWMRRTVEPERPLLLCPACRSQYAHVLRHIVGWRRGEHSADPAPLGATVQCLDCGAVWHATDRGAELAKPVAPTPKRDKPNPKTDDDLKWPWREKR